LNYFQVCLRPKADIPRGYRTEGQWLDVSNEIVGCVIDQPGLGSRFLASAHANLFLYLIPPAKAKSGFSRLNAAMEFFSDPAEVRASTLYKRFWYYGVELVPGVVTTGQYDPQLPMLARLMLRQCDLSSMACPDIGCMEGLMPVLMRRGGAEQVLAVDATDHCMDKLAAVKHYHDVEFDYRSVGLMYRLFEKLPGRSFDLINFSGLMYHVFSPLLVLAGIRPLLNQNGLLILSTHVILDSGFSMEFNNGGRMQVEPNTFWYLSVPLLDYLLRYMRLAPLDCIYTPHTAFKLAREYHFLFDKPSAYLSVLCRATDEILPTANDAWMPQSAQHSWEYLDFPRQRQRGDPASQIGYKGTLDNRFIRSHLPCIDLWRAVSERQPMTAAEHEADSYILRLADQS
jgi:2-polyprenyl-3-methyl-5-hydroxy-6-metoxy-1,4-benzoquinol methylase